MLKISPTSNAEYLLKLPPFDKIASPSAILAEEKTEISVSVDAVLFSAILFKSSANTIAKRIIESVVSFIPSTAPIAIPVNAECPNESEKNAIFLFTIIVPRIPNNGVMIRTANSAFFIKPYSNHSVKTACITLFPPFQRYVRTPHLHKLPSAFPALGSFYSAAGLCLHTLPHSPDHGRSG